MSKHGKEIEVPGDETDPRPVEVPTKLKRPETTDERIRRIIKEQISPHAVQQGLESFEESEDFDIEDDFESQMPLTKAEFQEMQREFPDQMEKLFPHGSPKAEKKGAGTGLEEEPVPDSGKEVKGETNTSEADNSNG